MGLLAANVACGVQRRRPGNACSSQAQLPAAEVRHFYVHSSFAVLQEMCINGHCDMCGPFRRFKKMLH